MKTGNPSLTRLAAFVLLAVSLASWLGCADTIPPEGAEVNTGLGGEREVFRPHAGGEGSFVCPTVPAQVLDRLVLDDLGDKLLPRTCLGGVVAPSAWLALSRTGILLGLVARHLRVRLARLRHALDEPRVCRRHEVGGMKFVGGMNHA